jgi:hypothetical protein
MRILLLLLFAFTSSFGQEFLTPTAKKTFALNRHTNRDVSYFSTIDSAGDIIVTSTTERDSTYTDILTTKLDKELNLIWKKRYSVDNYISYDVPLATHVDKNNNIITIGRTIVSNLSDSTGVLFIVCYNAQGSELWHYYFDNPSTPKNYNYRFQKSFLDEENILHVVNSVDNEDPQKVDVNFYSFNDKGVVVEKYTQPDLIQYIGNSNIFNDFFYHDGFYYMLYRKSIMYTREPLHYVKKIGKNSVIDVPLNPIIDIEDSNNFIYADLQFDKFNNVYVSYPSYKNGFINVLKFDASLSLLYKSVGANGGMRHLLTTYFNLDGHLCLLNYIDKDEINNSVRLSLLELDDKGSLYKETIKSNIVVNNFKKNKDNSFFIETKDAIHLYDEKLNLINNFQQTGLDIDDFCKLDNETLILAGTTYDKGYPTSDYYTELDVVVQKVQPEKVLKTYRYSGEGTSKAFGQKILIDNKNNYIIASEEKLGPDNLGIGGSRGPLQRNLYKYDSNLKLIWTIEIPYNIIGLLTSEDVNMIIDLENNIYINARTEEGKYKFLKISEQGELLFDVPSYQSGNIYFDKEKNINVVSLPVSNPITIDEDTTIYNLSSKDGSLLASKVFEGVNYLGNFTAKNGDSYTYMYPGDNNPYNNTNPRIEVYKNLNLEFQRKISFEGTYTGMAVSSIDSNGTLFFSSAWGQIEYKLHRLSLLNDYKYIKVNKRINRIACTSGNTNFMITDNHELTLYNKDLEVIAQGTELYSGYSSLFEVGDYLLVNTYWDNLVKVVDKKAQLVRSFKLPGELAYTRSAKDASNNIILTGRNGVQIYTYSSYSWYRGFIHKYNILDQMLGVDEQVENHENFDIKVYPNPTSSIVNVAMDKDHINKIELYDFSGKLILSSSKSNKIDISKLPKAIYFLKVELTNGNDLYEKIVKN